MRNKEILMLEETLKIFKKGHYRKNGRRIELKLSKSEQHEVKVFLPSEIDDLKDYKLQEKVHMLGRCGHSCENIDSFSMARKRYIDCSHMFTNKNAKEILVLNFANPVHPGGGVRRGAL